MKWFKVIADLPRHPKRFKFETLLGTPYGLHYLTLWFVYVCDFYPYGEIDECDPAHLAKACEWPHEPQKLWDALLGAGFLEKTKKGYEAHNWFRENGRFIKENEHRKPVGNPRETRDKPKGNPRKTRATVRDVTVLDNTLPTQDQKPPLRVSVLDPAFEEFYTRYPVKSAKQDALKAWNQVKPNPEAVQAALKWQIPFWAQPSTKDNFIPKPPYPATYLRGRRWEDERPRVETHQDPEALEMLRKLKQGKSPW